MQQFVGTGSQLTVRSVQLLLGATLVVAAVGHPSIADSKALVSLSDTFECEKACAVALPGGGPRVPVGAGTYNILDLASKLEFPEPVWGLRLRLPGVGWLPKQETVHLERCHEALRSIVVRTTHRPEGLFAEFSLDDSLWNDCGGPTAKTSFRLGSTRLVSPVLPSATLFNPATTPVIAGRTYSLFIGVDAQRYVLYAGEIEIPESATPLQQMFARANADPWFEGNWLAGTFRIYTSHLVPRPELATAANAGFLWVEGNIRTNGRRRWQLLPYQDGLYFELPDALISEFAELLFGREAKSVALSHTEWTQLIGKLQICQAATYGASGLAPRCRPLSSVVALRVPKAPRVQLSTTSYTITPSGFRATGPRQVIAGARDPLVALVGDEMALLGRVRQGGATLFRCIENYCTPVGARSSQIGTTGLLELRWAASSMPEQHRQALTVARLIVIDPSSSWIPTGLSVERWDRVPADDLGAFAFTRRGYTVSSALVLSAAAAAVLPGGGAASGTRLDLAPRHDSTPREPLPPFIVMVRADAGCPRVTGARANEGNIHPTERLIDQPFFIVLAHVPGPDQPIRCLAQARFRVRPERSLRSGQFRVRFIGDPLLTFESASGGRAGIVLPVTSVSRPLRKYVVAETSVGVFASVDIEERAEFGARVWTSILFGPSALPRLAVLGGGIDAAGTSDVDAFVFVGVNLGAIYDYAGGR